MTRQPKLGKKKAPMRNLPVFVQYVSVRRCRHNPSFDRFSELSKGQRDTLLESWEKRHPHRSFPSI